MKGAYKCSVERNKRVEQIRLVRYYLQHEVGDGSGDVY